VERFEFILGKYLGLLLTLAVNTAIMTAGFYLALIWQKRQLGTQDLAPLEAIFFILLELAMAVGVALLFSTLTTPVLSAVFTLSLYVIGNSLSDLRSLGEHSGGAAASAILRFLSWVLPDFGVFGAISQAAHGELIPRYRLIANSLYAALYVTVLVSAAVLVFEEREFQ